MKKITLLFMLTTFVGFAQPTTNATAPTKAATDVISIYSATYTDVATNYDPNWGQSGHNMVNSSYDPGTGNLILAYPNFNYQGTELAAQNASGMEFLHVDIWTAADPGDTIIQVSPVNNGTGSGEVLVTINHTAGSWTSVDIPKADFVGMTWDSVFQMKFAANGSGSSTPVDIYLDNIYFWKASVAANSDASLSDLLVDGTTINGFNSSALNYTYNVPNGASTVPTITATTTNNLANAVVTPASGIPGTTSILVTAQDGTTMQTYTVEFIEDLPAPSNNAIAPIHNETNNQVISIFSDVYTDVVGTNFDPNWGQGTNATIEMIVGNQVLKYDELNYQGTEYTTQNVSGLDKLHVDYWTANSTTIDFFLISPGGNETSVSLPITSTETWLSMDIDLSSYSSIVDLTNAFQFKVVGDGTVWFDNLYFYNSISLGINDFEASSFSTYPNPTQNNWTVKSQNNEINSIHVFDILGKNVLTLLPNNREAVIDGSNLKSGLYFAQIKTETGINSIKLVKN